MIIISQLPSLDSLPIPQSLKTFLNQHLIQSPFGSQETAQHVWATLDNHLVFLNSEDKLFLSSDPTDLKVPIQHIHRLIECPEYVLNAPDNYCLALVITDQEGSGLYLLFPKDTQCPVLQSLISKAEEV